MTWVIQNDSDKQILEEMLKQSDRGAALIATAYLEERLVDAIKARLNRCQAIENKLFKGTGPLASLSARIDFGFLLGIYDPSAHRILRTIKDIRNRFAHKAEPLNFNTQNIKDLCAKIDISGGIDITLKAPDGTSQRVVLDIEPDGTPKTAFLNAVKFLLFALDMEIKIAPPRVPAPPVVPPIEKIQPPPKKS